MVSLYILQSEVDGSYYVGITNDLKTRLQTHNSGQNRSTAKKRPWKIIYSERHATRSEARKRELQIKKKKSKKSIARFIMRP